MDNQITLNKIWGHFKTITHHKKLVMEGCFKIGLYWQGLTHDLSKYSWVEFKTGAMYFQGDRSPNAAEREDKGFSEAWIHHKGHNKHHYEYWMDMGPVRSLGAIGVKMPVKYVAEMVIDRIAASKVYQGSAYTDRSAYEYFLRTEAYMEIHPETKKVLEKILKMLAIKGETYTFAYLRKVFLKRNTY